MFCVGTSIGSRITGVPDTAGADTSTYDEDKIAQDRWNIFLSRNPRLWNNSRLRDEALERYFPILRRVREVTSELLSIDNEV